MQRTRLIPALVALSLPSSAQDAGGADGIARLDRILRDVVRPDGVDYPSLRARLPELASVHAWFAAHGPEATPTEFPSVNARKAYWLNAYNATVLRGVAEAPASMRNVLTYLPASGFFRARRWRVDGRERTLDEIENREVRPVFRDARVHFALNCAARACPPLRPGAYTAAGVDAQLDAQTRAFLNAPGSVRVDPATRRVTVVQLFEWFGDDFAAPIPGGVRRAVPGALGFIHAFAAAPLRATLESVCLSDAGACALAFTPYDWTLNEHR